MKKNLQKKQLERVLLGRRITRSPRWLLILPLLCCVSVLANGNPARDSVKVKEYLVKGQVTDEKGYTMPGVTVLLDSTKVGVITDVNGNFQLKLARSGGVLVFSFIGYETVKATFRAGQPLNVRMKESISKLDEVTVVAYGTQSKREVVGAMSVVRGEDIRDVPSPSLSNLLPGASRGDERDEHDGRARWWWNGIEYPGV